MELDILNPEFFVMAEKAKAIFEAKEEEIQAFKALWLKHKQKLADLDKQAAVLKGEYTKKMAEHQAKEGKVEE